MNNDIQSQCRKLGMLASGLATPAKGVLTETLRVSKFIGKQHGVTMNQYNHGLFNVQMCYGKC